MLFKSYSPRTQTPIVDPYNPLYDPTVTPSSYLASLHRSLSHSNVYADGSSLYTFARIMDENYFGQDVNDSPPGYIHNTRYRLTAHSRNSFSPLPAYSSHDWERKHLPAYSPDFEGSHLKQDSPFVFGSEPDRVLTIKRRHYVVDPISFSDLEGPNKRGRSSESIHNSSFDLSGPKILFNSSVADGASALGPRYIPVHESEAPDEADFLSMKVRALEDLLYGPPIGSETPRGMAHLLQRLDELLPGTGVTNRILVPKVLSHENVVDLLGKMGYLTTEVLDMFRMSEICSLDLSSSAHDEDGLNISGRDILLVFSKPNSFLFLSELKLSGTPIKDYDLVNIQHLPRLSKLLLEDTQIGNEAVYHLVALKRTLKELDISSNPLIDDNSIHPLLLLAKLSYISLLDTGIAMIGLRRLAQAIQIENRIIDVEIPKICEYYIDNMNTKYMVDIKAPFISDPTACSILAVTALKGNLAEHALSNPNILTTGSKAELIARLEGILEMRQMDMLIKDMIWGD